MRQTISLGRVRGIALGVHWSVLVIAALLAWGLTGGESDLVLWAVVVPMVVVFLGSLLAHELAHSVVAQRNGVEVRGITLWLLGGVAQLGGRIPSAGAQFRIAAAGPATSYGLGIAFFGLARVAADAGASALVVSAIDWLAFVNVVLGTFNLIPAAPLDGGRILASAIWAVTKDRARAEIGATRVGQAFGVLLIAAGVAGTAVEVPFVSLWTAFIGLFVYRTASMELSAARAIADWGATTVGDVMVPCPPAMRGWLTVSAADEDLAAAPDAPFRPVVAWDGSLVGLVEVARLARVPVERRTALRVQDAAVPLDRVGAVRREDPMSTVAARLRTTALPVALVFDGSHLVGMVSRDARVVASDAAPVPPPPS
jgi:Zn-dependent protease